MNEQIAAPQSDVLETPQMGMVGRFLAVFTDPRKAFTCVRKNHEWIIVLVLAAAVSIGSYQFTKPIIRKDVIAQLEEQLKSNPNVSAERRQEIMDTVAARFDNPWLQFLGPVWMLVVFAVVAGILLFLGNILMGGQTNFLTVLNMYALTWLVVIPETIVKVPLVISKSSTKVETSLALLLSAENSNKFLQTLLGKFDLFGLWQLALVILGLSVLCRTSFGKSAAAVGAAWFILVLIQAGLASIGLGFSGA